MNYAHDLSNVEGRADIRDAFSGMRKITSSPSHAERAKTLVAQASSGSLATIARRPEGYPFGSTVDYALDARGRPILSLSTLAEHTKNAKKDARASLLVLEPERESEVRLAGGRVTLVGTLEPGTDDETLHLRESYLAAHPDSLWVDFGDFSFYVLHVEAVRYVGGFGAMSWVTADAYVEAEPDPLADAKFSIIEHMNDDHVAAMVDIARADGHDASIAKMIDCDRYGFDVELTHEESRESVRFAYGELCDTPNLTRQAMIRMVGEARAKLSA